MRRMFSLFAVLLPLIVASCTDHEALTMAVGTYSDAFYVYRFDSRNGRVSSRGIFPEAPGAFTCAILRT